MLGKKQHTKTILYLLLQILGWGIYVGLVGFSLVAKLGFTSSLLLFLSSIWLFNIAQSHLYRLLVIRLNWAANSVSVLLLKVLLSSIVLGVTFAISTTVFNMLFTNFPVKWFDVNNMLSGFFLYFMWNLIYFVYAYIEKSREQEIKNLKLSAAKNEIELQNLRTQLNPHFMFNAMNSIKALIDESPKEAKQSVTKLSNILRSALTYSTKNTIPLLDEIALVHDYLALEKIRYEERLTFSIQVQDGCNQLQIPPLLLQTLVENGIKHGVAKRIKGGEITIVVAKNNNQLAITINNTGQLAEQSKTSTGIGLVNTRKRLQMEYGEQATLTLQNVDEHTVQTTVAIPLS